MNEHIRMACSVCKEINYDTFKNKKNHPERLKMNKFCPKCRKHTEHTEIK